MINIEMNKRQDFGLLRFFWFSKPTKSKLKIKVMTNSKKPRTL